MSRLPDTLRAVGAVLGYSVIITDDDTWHRDERGLRVGLGWYTVRGHSEAEAVALAALHLWEGPRSEAREPERAARIRSLSVARPEALPLIQSVVRLQARAELLSAMPGLRDSLDAALRRALPSSIETLPRHMQWVTQIWLHALGVSGAPSPAVAHEWDALMHTREGIDDPLRRVLARDPRITALRSMQRALTLLLPPYERLLARDRDDRGLTSVGLGVSDERSEAVVERSDTAVDRTTEVQDPEDPTDESTADDENHQLSLSDDLYAREHAALVRTMLETPLPSEYTRIGAASAEAIDAQSTTVPVDASAEDHEHERATIAVATALADYRARSTALAGAIERMRQVWARVIAERASAHRVLSRTAHQEGVSLAPEAFAQTIAETLAGVSNPAAFHAREWRISPQRDVGNTDYVLMVDRSASMTGPAAAAAADALIVLAEGLSAVTRDIAHTERALGVTLELEVRSSLIVFGAEAHVIKPLSHGMDDEVRRRVHAAVRETYGSTNDAAALWAAGEELGVGHRAAWSGGEARRRIAVLVSDGGSNDPSAAERALWRLRESGVEVYGVGIGTDDVTQRYAPHGIRVDDARELASAIDRILDEPAVRGRQSVGVGGHSSKKARESKGKENGRPAHLG